jgi:hypothetical protein
MFSRVRLYFRDAHLARMSDGTYRIIRDLGLVKGGKGMRHHEVLMTLTLRALSRRIWTQGLSTVRHLTQQASLPGAQRTDGNDGPNNVPATKS